MKIALLHRTKAKHVLKINTVIDYQVKIQETQIALWLLQHYLSYNRHLTLSHMRCEY